MNLENINRRPTVRPASTYHHGQLPQALVDAALDGLERDGQLPSLRALAHACDVSHAAPYRHFDSVDGLRAAAIEACFRRFTAYLTRVMHFVSEPRARVGAVIRAYLRFARRHPHWYALMFGQPVNPEAYPDTVVASKAAFELLKAAVRDCGAREPNRVAHVLWAAHHGLADLFCHGFGPGNRAAEQALIDGLLQMSLAYVNAAA